MQYWLLVSYLIQLLNIIRDMHPTQYFIVISSRSISLVKCIQIYRETLKWLEHHIHKSATYRGGFRISQTVGEGKPAAQPFSVTTSYIFLTSAWKWPNFCPSKSASDLNLKSIRSKSKILTACCLVTWRIEHSDSAMFKFPELVTILYQPAKAKPCNNTVVASLSVVRW